MGLTSLQVCMDSSDWMQSISSPPLEDMIPCSRPLLEKRLRPQPDPAKCPRCDSTHTKFCYYNNYSLSQPRYFCKTCRRYWTKGGSLRNVPVGGGCRKNKRSVAVKKTQDQSLNQLPTSSSPISLPHLNTVYGNARNHDFMENTILGNPGSFGNPNFKESKYGTELGFLCEGMGSREMNFLGEQGDRNHGFMASGFHGLCSLGLTMDKNDEEFMEGGERLDFPFEIENRGEMKPRIQVSDQINKPLCIEWQEQDNCEVGKDPSGYWSGLGTWSGLMNSYGTSTALVQNLD